MPWVLMGGRGPGEDVGVGKNFGFFIFARVTLKGEGGFLGTGWDWGFD